MKKTVTKKIRDKIFKKDDVLRISKKIFDLYKKSKSGDKLFHIELRCDNEETFDIENSDLNNNIELLDIKKILRININFIDYRNDKRIKLNLSPGNDEWNNGYAVEGKTRAWVDTSVSQLDEILVSVTPQNRQYSKFKKIISNISATSIGFLFLRIVISLLKRFNYQPGESSSSDPFAFIVKESLNSFNFLIYPLTIITSWMIGSWSLLFFWSNIEKYLDNLWPSIEFDFGPEYKKHAKKKRETWGIILSLIIIPILLQFLFI